MKLPRRWCDSSWDKLLSAPGLSTLIADLGDSEGAVQPGAFMLFRFASPL